MDTSQIKGPEFLIDKKKELAEFGNILFDMSASTNPERHRNFLTYYAYKARDYITGWGRRLTPYDRYFGDQSKSKPVPPSGDQEL